MARLKVRGTSHEKIVILIGLKGPICIGPVALPWGESTDPVALPWGEATGSVERCSSRERKYWQEPLL